MDESSRNDLEVLLLAVQQGELTNTQVEECLREWGTLPEKDPGRLQALAQQKGYVSADRLRELSALRPRDPDHTTLRVEVVMACIYCGTERTLPLDSALEKTRCPKCPGPMRFERQASVSRNTTLHPSDPEEVRSALRDAKNRFAKYVLLNKLGTGGMGEVWRAWDTVMHRSVALKFPRTTGEEEIRRLYLEAQGAGGLSHPNIASIYEIAEAEGRHYIAMQYIQGKTAEESLKPAKPETREIVRWARDAALGVHYAHERGVIHRDLKPANIMIDLEGRVFVMDFGLAKLVGGEGSATVSGAILGTPAFMPPEQAAANAGQVDRRSDVYALGATLYVLLSGRRPFEGDSATDILVQILTSHPPTLREAWPGAPWELEAIVARAMSRTREGRYDTAKDFAADLDRFLGHEPIEASRQTFIHRIARAVRRKPAALAAAAFVLLASATVYFYASSLRRPASIPAGPDRLKLWSEMFPRLQAACSVETFDPAAARPLLERTRKDFPEQEAGINLLLDREWKEVTRAIQELPRSAWLDSAPRVRRYRDWLQFAHRPTDPADRILQYRGTIALTVQIAPYAELRGPLLEGLPAEERMTPLAVKELEIREGDLELVHPQLGRRSLALPPLKNGSTLVIEGSLRKPDSITITEVP